VFILRAVLALVFAVFIARAFYPQTELVKVMGLAVIIVGLAYFAEYLRQRRR
jgi:heme/copper-type cytochrome/quinol oxidase subunit 4